MNLGLNNMVPLDEDEISGRRDALKYRVIFIALSRTMAIFVYAAVIFMINNNFDGRWATLFIYMLIVVMLQDLFYIICLLYGALKAHVVYYTALIAMIHLLYKDVAIDDNEGIQTREYLYIPLLGLAMCFDLLCSIIILLAGSKLSVVYYALLFMLIRWYSVGEMVTVIQVITLVAIPCQVAHGVLLFYGAIEEVLWALDTAIWFCLAIAAYNTILGIMGGIYFIRNGEEAIHFVIAAFFCLMAFSLFTVLCHDIVIIYSLKKTIAFAPPLSETYSSTEVSPPTKL